jgi:hypothetical protein
MLHYQQAILPGESVGIFPRRKQNVPSQQRAVTTSSVAAKQSTQHVATAAQSPANTLSREREEILRDYAAGIPSVDMSEYFRGVLNEIKEDSVVIDPIATYGSANSISESPSMNVIGLADSSEDEKLLRIIKLLYVLVKRSHNVELQLPVAHSAIIDRRLYFDSLNITSTFNGDINGEIRVNFANLTNMTPPENVVKITILPFMFPHIYRPNNRIFDTFCNKTAYMTLRSVPKTYLAQTRESDAAFTFELNVAQDDNIMMYLAPKEQTFILTQPVSFQSEICVRFQERLPTGTFQNCDLPPSQVLVRRLNEGFPTTFQFIDDYYIGILAPPWATYPVPVLFKSITPNAPSLLDAAMVNDIGFVTSSYSIVGGRGQFTLVWDSTGVVMGVNESIIMLIPKNSIGFSIRFSEVSSKKTNDLVPIHT